jgi:hypothetical protein
LSAYHEREDITVASVREGKGFYYIAMGDLKRIWWFRNVAQRSFEFVLPASPLACVTFTDILSHVLVHPWPPVSQGHNVQGSLPAWVGGVD